MLDIDVQKNRLLKLDQTGHRLRRILFAEFHNWSWYMHPVFFFILGGGDVPQPGADCEPDE